MPGSVHHRWARFSGPGAKAEAQKWIDETLDRLRTANPVVGRFGFGILSERDAAKVRYRDGRRVYADRDD
jgi:hypothetical protein